MKMNSRHEIYLKAQQAYLLSFAACGLLTLFAKMLAAEIDPANIMMIYLLVVFLISVNFGRGPGLLATLLSVGLFDFYFVPPTFSFSVLNAQYLLTFFIMGLVALITGQMAAKLKLEAELSSEQADKAKTLYEMARALAQVNELSKIEEIVAQSINQVAIVNVHLIFKEQSDVLAAYSALDAHLLRATLERKTIHEADLVIESDGVYYIALVGANGVCGVLAIQLPQDLMPMDDALRDLLMTMSSMIASVIERLHFAQLAQQSEIQSANERLRSSILTALSHDLRTPLTVLVGMIDTLLMDKQSLTDAQKALAETSHKHAMRLNAMVTNLLDMVRLHTGNIQMRKNWQPLEDVIGASIQLLASALQQHQLTVQLPPNFPLLEFDEVLIERVFCNLLENAAKYAPQGSSITIKAEVNAEYVVVSVIDSGTGVPPNKLEKIFQIFVRGGDEQHQATSGSGIGLAVCKAIVEAHGGQISANNLAEGGACFSFSLPIGNPPALEDLLSFDAPN